MNANSITIKLNKVIEVMIIIIVLILTIGRMFLGVEITDEAYAVAENYLVSEGGLPFVNNWSQMPGFTLLLFPFIRIYVLLTGSTEGIVLFTRLLCVTISIVVALILFLLLRKLIHDIWLRALCVLPYIGVTGIGLFSYRGDNVAILLFALGVMLVVLSFFDLNKSEKYLFIGGILLALGVMCYPTMAIQYFYLVIVLLFLYIKNEKNVRKLGTFISGSILSALVVISYLVVNSSFSELLHGIVCILKDVTYFQIEHKGARRVPDYIEQMLAQEGRVLLISGICFGILLMGDLIKILIRKTNEPNGNNILLIKKELLRKLLLMSFVCGVCGGIVSQIFEFGTVDSANITIYATAVEFMAVPLFWIFVKVHKKISNYLMGLVWLPNIVWVIVTGASTHSGMFKRNALLVNAAYLSGVFLVWAIKDTFFVSKDKKEVIKDKSILKEFLVSLIPIIYIAIIIFTNIFNAYSYVYRELPIGKLDTLVESGPYKGIYTSSRRNRSLVQVEEIIREYTDETDYLLALDNNPAIYLMSDAKPCTPSTWDQALYTYGFDAPELYYDYFDVVGKKPTKIVYFNYGRDEILSIDTDYKFNEFILENYNLIYENRNVCEWNYKGTEYSGCELLIYERKR